MIQKSTLGNHIVRESFRYINSVTKFGEKDPTENSGFL